MPLPAWVPAPGFLANAPSDDGTLDSLADVDPGLAVGTYGSPASGLLAWNSAVFLPDAGTLGGYVMILGGHGNYAGNCWWKFDVATRQWSILSTNSSGLTSTANPTAWADSKGRYADGKPGSPHTYGNIVATPATIAYPQGRAVLVGGSYMGFTGSVTTKYIHAIDIATGAHAASATALSHAGEPNGSGCYDPVRDVIWAFGTQSGTSECQQIDPDTLALGAVQYISETGSPNWRFYVLSCYHPASDLIVQRVAYGATNGIFLFNPATLQRVAATTSGTGPSATEGAGFEYCDLDGCFYAYVPGQTKVFKLTPPASSWWTGTWAWSTENFDAGSDTPAYATYAGTEINRMQRWRWVPVLESFLWIDTVSQVPQLYRPASASTGGVAPLPSDGGGTALLSFPNRLDGSVLSGGDWGTTLNNLLTRDLGEVAESASLNPADTQFVIDMTATHTVRVVHLRAHNLTADAGVTISFGTTSGGAEAGTSGEFMAWQMAFDGVMRNRPDANAVVGYPYDVVYVHPTDVECRYVLVEISDLANPHDAVRVGRAFAGAGAEFRFAVGSSINWSDPTPVSRRRGGSLSYQQATPYRVASISVSVIGDTFRRQLAETHRAAGSHGEVSFIADSLDAPGAQEFGFVGRLAQVRAMAWQTSDRVTSGFELEELL